jgi:hypothetical protein
MATLRLGLALALAASPLACSRTNPFFCAGSPNGVCADAGSGSGGSSDAAVDAPAQHCGSAADCTGDPGHPACDTGKDGGTCVECTGSDDGLCSGNTPTCSPDDTCVACGSDGDCSNGGACLANGACADPSGVLFASPNGNGDCSAGSPCSFDTAVAIANGSAAVSFVIDLAAGTYPNTQENIDAHADIIGRGATLVGNGGGGPVIDVVAGTVRLDFVTISKSPDVGVECDAGSMTLFAVSVLDSAQDGVDSNCDVTILRSKIARNKNGGAHLSGGDIDVENTWIVRNGLGVNPSDPGLTMSTTGTALVRFDTVAFNNIAGLTSAAGIQCITPVPVSQTIEVGNRAGGAPHAQDSGCTDDPVTTHVDATGNGSDLAFVDTAALTFDFHLTATSPDTVRDVDGNNGSNCVGAIDIDGSARPINALCDLGADEFDPNNPDPTTR